MPIQFRCGSCQQLLGIARRKAGSVVDCPTCGTKTLVPKLAEEAGAAPPPPPVRTSRKHPVSIFDKVDVDKLLQKPLKPEVVESDSALAVAPPPVRRKMVFTSNLLEEPLEPDSPVETGRAKAAPEAAPREAPRQPTLSVEELLGEDPLRESPSRRDTVRDEEPKALEKLPPDKIPAEKQAAEKSLAGKPTEEEGEPENDEPFALTPLPVLTPERQNNSTLWLSLALTAAAVAIAAAFLVGHWVGANRPLF